MHHAIRRRALREILPLVGGLVLGTSAAHAQDKASVKGKRDIAPTPAVAAAPVIARPLAVGQSLAGTITETSARLEQSNPVVRYELYTLSGRGERVRVMLRTEEFTGTVMVAKVTASGEEEVAMDYGAGAAVVTFVADGQYRIYAGPINATSTGAYTISAESAPVVSIVPRRIAVGQTVSGTLAAADPTTDRGEYFHQYTITAPPGENLRVVLTSRRFDAFLAWGRVAGAALEDVSTDDDGFGDTDAQLNVVMPSEGVYVIRVISRGVREVGPYDIKVERRQ